MERNLFLNNYDILPVKQILSKNIRTGYEKENIHTLYQTVLPLSTLLNNISVSEAANLPLHTYFINKLSEKEPLLNLLPEVGYMSTNGGPYEYHAPVNASQENKRKILIDEIQQFCEDLKNLKDRKNPKLERSLQQIINDVTSNDQHDFERTSSPLQKSSSFRSSPVPLSTETPRKLPNSKTVTDGNQRTIEKIKHIKEQIEPKYDRPCERRFVRRKLLLNLVQEKNPEINIEANYLETSMDETIRTLKESDKRSTHHDNDEIYIECLLRANFETSSAKEMLLNNRPNLNTLQYEVKTDITGCIARLKQQYDKLTEEGNDTEQQLLREGDEWKNTYHIQKSLVQLRNQYQLREDESILVGKVYRLLRCELMSIVDKQISRQTENLIKLELLANALCSIELSCLANVDMGDIKDILRSPIDQDFAIKALSTPCNICFDSFPRSQIESLFYQCEHTWCRSCAKEYYRKTVNKINDLASLKQLVCFSCNHNIPDDERAQFLTWLEGKFIFWFSSERKVLDTYHENLFHATRGEKIKRCGSPKCLAFFDVHNNQIMRVQCPQTGCRFLQCAQCCRKWHDEHLTRNLTCEEYGEWLISNDPDSEEAQMQRYLATAGMSCPQCNAIYEYRPGGCEHFKCSACKSDFCRICSGFFYDQNRPCPSLTCNLKQSLHAHCPPNCFREIRDFCEIDKVEEFLRTQGISFKEELDAKPQATTQKCPVDDCKNPASNLCNNRFCEKCYQEFLCLFLWRNQLEPWSFYEQHQLRQKLSLATPPVIVPETTTKEELITLARQHLPLGKPKTLPKVLPKTEN